MIRILYVPIGEEPRVKWIDDSEEGCLRMMQALVGGNIEAVTIRILPPYVELYCNEDGISLELAPNGCSILGPYFFSAADLEGNPRSLDSAEIAACLLYHTMFRDVQHPCARK